MPTCSICHQPFDVDDFMDDNVESSDVCPDCYYGGDMFDSEDDYDPYEDNDESCFDDDDDDEFERDFDDRLAAEEGDYE